MNTRCKSGDLAIIAYDVPGCEDDIGRIVAIPATGGFCFMEPGETTIEHPDDWITPVNPDDLDEGVPDERMKGVPA